MKPVTINMLCDITKEMAEKSNGDQIINTSVAIYTKERPYAVLCVPMTNNCHLVKSFLNAIPAENLVKHVQDAGLKDPEKSQNR